jgi:hypothetical protein
MSSNISLPVEFRCNTAAVDSQAHVTERLRLGRAINALNATKFFGENSELRLISEGPKAIVVALVNRATNEVIEIFPIAGVLRLMTGLSSAATRREAPAVGGQDDGID